MDTSQSNKPSDSRPTEVTVLGVIGAVVGLKLTLLGISVFQLLAIMMKSHEWPGVLNFIVSVSLLQTPVSAVGCVAGFNLLYRREWARSALEVVNWIAFAFVTASSMRLLYAYTSMKSQEGWDANGVVMVIFGLLAGMTAISLPVIMIDYLRSDTVRQAMIHER